MKGRGGLVVRRRLRCRRVPGSKADSTQDPPYGLLHIKSYLVAKGLSSGAVREVREDDQNYDVRRKISLTLVSSKRDVNIIKLSNNKMIQMCFNGSKLANDSQTHCNHSNGHHLETA
ncbi:hypothetical protein AVEN_76259-1 [Araneus ventricosus]|uniref:Uncharacterized protein n=1 Tax=Araneus ventricosus TaxID=182803 RepID=A0A4Y2GLN6_ARAVE|nr:hypothetical protein AVEN_76259-1 [Araneus ventricosus]